MMQPLTNPQLMALVPSAFAERPHESRSGRYAFIPTIQVIDALRAEGLFPVAAKQTRVRLPGKRGFTKHLIRFRPINQMNEAQAGEVAPEVVMRNAHDGSSNYLFIKGLFRFICMNGLIVLSQDLGSLKVRHIGGQEVVQEALEASFRIIGSFDETREHISQMRNIAMSPDQQRDFARNALTIRYPALAIDGKPFPITPDQVLAARRGEDHGNSLWLILNRVQENLMTGGLMGLGPRNQIRRTRAITGIDQGMTLNQTLWAMADGFRQQALGMAAPSSISDAEVIN